MCCSCIKKCPVEAKYFSEDRIDKMKKYLIVNCSLERKEPVIFI